MTIIDTPEGIAFAKASARLYALEMELRGLKRKGRSAYSIIKQVYGFRGNRATVAAMLHEYVDGVLETRSWSPEYGKRIVDIAQEAIRRAEEEHGSDPRLKDYADANVQAFFEAGNITEQEGNDACLLIFIEVVRVHADAVEHPPIVADSFGPDSEQEV